MSGKTIGYIRVSSVEQNTERQLEGVVVDKVFTDKCSGKDTKRPQLAAALDYARDGDIFVVHSMDRLARNVEDMRRMVRELTARGVAVRFVKENLTFTGNDSPMNNLMLTMLGAFAEFERALIRERQREGIAIAKAKGDVYKGRKPALTEKQVAELLAKAKSGIPKASLAREYNISRVTLYSYLEREAKPQ
jgi:DNA invertase Pin-like site-specific DNA recombinase